MIRIVRFHIQSWGILELITDSKCGHFFRVPNRDFKEISPISYLQSLQANHNFRRTQVTKPKHDIELSWGTMQASICIGNVKLIRFVNSWIKDSGIALVLGSRLHPISIGVDPEDFFSAATN